MWFTNVTFGPEKRFGEVYQNVSQYNRKKLIVLITVLFLYSGLNLTKIKINVVF